MLPNCDYKGWLTEEIVAIAEKSLVQKARCCSKGRNAGFRYVQGSSNRGK